MPEFKASFLKKLRNLTESDLVAVCFEMAERHPETFETILLTNTFEPPMKEFKVPIAGSMVKFTNEQMEQIRQLSVPDKKVTLIKLIREMTNLGLKEAKDLVEEYWIPVGRL